VFRVLNSVSVQMLQISGPLEQLGEGGLRRAMEPVRPLLIALPTASAPPGSPALVRCRDLNDAASCLVLLHGQQVVAGALPLDVWFFSGLFPELSSTGSHRSVTESRGLTSSVSTHDASASGHSSPQLHGAASSVSQAMVAPGHGYSGPMPSGPMAVYNPFVTAHGGSSDMMPQGGPLYPLGPAGPSPPLGGQHHAGGQ